MGRAELSNVFWLGRAVEETAETCLGATSLSRMRELQLAAWSSGMILA